MQIQPGTPQLKLRSLLAVRVTQQGSFSASKAKLDALRVQVPSTHILTQNLSYNCYYPNTKYLTVGYLDP